MNNSGDYSISVCFIYGLEEKDSKSEVTFAVCRLPLTLCSTSRLTQILRREKHRIARHYSAKLQTTKQTFTTSKHAIEFTYSDFPCHFKVNRDKVALTNRPWMCKRRQKIDDYR